MPYVNQRWIGGFLTNFRTIRTRIKKYKELLALREQGYIESLDYKEQKRVMRELEKLDKYYSGVKDMDTLPDILFVVDTKKEEAAIREAKKIGIPVVAMIDTNCDPDLVDYPIPANDDAVRAIKLITSKIADAILEGREGRQGIVSSEGQQASMEEIAEELEAIDETEKYLDLIDEEKEENNMEISASLVKQLRDETGAGFMECKKALEETGGDLEKAKLVLKEKGLARAEKKIGRAASQGLIHAYIHGEGKLGVLVEVNCETDFVARTDDFKELVHEIALQIAGMAPEYVAVEDVPEEVIEQEKEIYRKQAENEGKPAEIIDKIVEGKLQNFYKSKVLLEQPYVRDDSKTIKDLIKEKIALLGENIVVRRFARWTLGE